jgi:hypothetical protein
MKVGDTLPVTVQGIVVAQATVEAVEHDKVTFIVPGTRVQAGVRTVLEHETPVGEKETIVDGVVRTDNSSGEAAPVEAPQQDATSSVAGTETPAPETDKPVEPVADKPVEPAVSEEAQ